MPDPAFAHPRLARLYDVFDDDRSDLDHYEDLVAELGGRHVLDVGCGTGTLAIRLAARGLRVTAVDPARASLDVARAKPGADRVRWVEADALHLPVTEDVDVAVMTGNVAQVFLDDEEWAAVLCRAAAVLGPGGHLVLETRRPERRAWEEWTPEATRSTREVDGEGEVSAEIRVTQVHEPFVTFESTTSFADGTALVSESTLRFRSREEIESSLAEAHLALVDVREAPDRPGRELVVIARKDPDPRDQVDRGWRDMAAIDEALERGDIDEETWHARVLAILEPAYLSADTPHAQSGKGGDAADWEYSRSLVADAIDRDGSLLDVGCANSLLMTDVRRWAGARGHAVEPHGVDIGPGLVVGVHNLRDDDPLPETLQEWGFPVAGVARRPHRVPGTSYTVIWTARP